MKLFFKTTIFILMAFTLFSCDLAKSTGFSIAKKNKKAKKIPDLNYVFDLSAVPEVTIIISTNEWNTLLTNFDTEPKNEETVHADFVFNKKGVIETNTNIAFRIRGNTSRRRPEGDNPANTDSTPGVLHGAVGNYYHNAHFRVDFNDYSPGSRFHGLRALNLKWFKDDPAYSRDVYCYDLFKRFDVRDVPRSSYTRLYIRFKESGEDVYFGVYEMIESIDQSFIDARFTNNNGYLWKCLWTGQQADLKSPPNTMGMEVATLTEQFHPTYDLKTEKTNFTNIAKPMLEDFINQLNSLSGNSLKTWIDTHMDAEEFLRGLAVTVLVGSWDSYWGDANNYYLYFDDNGKAYFIPYDFDNTLGTGLSTLPGTSISFNPGTQDVFNWGIDVPLVSKLLAIPEYKTIYSNVLVELLSDTNYFDFTISTNRLKQWQALISPYMSGQDTVAENENNNNTIGDAPASWANYDYYYLFSGTNDGAGGSLPGANYFKSRIFFAKNQLGIGYAKNYAQISIAGTFTGWNPVSMALVADHLWKITQTVSSNDEYKFNVGDWSINWGDNDDDFIGDFGGTNITNLLNGSVTFLFHDDTFAYTNF